jgi:hypothetical protein
VRHRYLAGETRNVHDHTVVTQQRQRCVRQQHRPSQVSIEDGAELFCAALQKRTAMIAAGAVDDEVKAAEMLLHLLR